VLFPWLFPMPRPRLRLILVSLLMGGGNSTLIFVALKTATPSEVAVVSQLGVPITTVLSMVMLGEQVRWRRGIGIAMTLAGALTVMWDPAGVHASVGLYYVVAACFVGSLGAVMMKQLAGVRPLQFQAWVGLTSLILLAPFSLAFEPGQIDVAIAAGWALAAAIAYSALAGSVGAHTGFYILMQRYEANLIMPLMLMTPLATIGLGVLITHDPFDLRMGIGTLVALTGVLIIALRPSRIMPLLLAWRNRAQ
jgi:O-acetylserine/cysteine efflux transporter